MKMKEGVKLFHEEGFKK